MDAWADAARSRPIDHHGQRADAAAGTTPAAAVVISSSIIRSTHRAFPRRSPAARSAARGESSPCPSTAPRAARRPSRRRTAARSRGAWRALQVASRCVRATSAWRRLVEADVTVGADAEDLQIDAAGALDRALRSARTPRAASRAAPFRKCNAARRRRCSAVEQMPLHERAIAAAGRAGSRPTNSSRLKVRHARPVDPAAAAVHLDAARDTAESACGRSASPSTRAGLRGDRFEHARRRQRWRTAHRSSSNRSNEPEPVGASNS